MLRGPWAAALYSDETSTDGWRPESKKPGQQLYFLQEKKQISQIVAALEDPCTSDDVLTLPQEIRRKLNSTHVKTWPSSFRHYHQNRCVCFLAAKCLLTSELACLQDCFPRITLSRFESPQNSANIDYSIKLVVAMLH